MINIKSYNADQLYTLIYSEWFNSLKQVPITRHRALSQLKNPRLEPNDTILLIAFQNQEIVGYVGILPDHFLNSDNEFIRLGWLTSLWVSPNHRRKGIAHQLVKKSLSDWNKKIMVADYAPYTKSLYDKIGIFNDYKLQGIRLYVKLDLQNILPPKRAIFSKLKPFWKLVDGVFNAVLGITKIRDSKLKQDFNIRQVDHVSKETSEFINAQQHKNLFKRNFEELNWILHNPWILEKHQTKQEYHFSDTDSTFKQMAFEIYDNNKVLIAFLVFNKRKATLKLPYCYYSCPVTIIGNVIEHFIIKWKIKTFTTFQHDIADNVVNEISGKLFSKKVERNYLISNYFDSLKLPSDFSIQDGDADCTFT